MAKRANPFLGKWRIVEMDEWDRDYIDLVVPGHITFASDGLGSFQFGTVQGWLDCRIERDGDSERVEFSWQGVSETDPACGRGWATIQGGELHGHLYTHASDDSAFRARKVAAKREQNAA